MSDVILRDLSGMAEFGQAEALQRAVWGPDDSVDPADLMMVIQSEGGLVAGAFRGNELVGYVFGLPTRAPHVQHSHRLAVQASERGLGLGRRLKWYQREWCLQRGISHVRWTFDPLRLANASLNIHRLGGVAHTYHPDCYGPMAGINKGTPSDRLLVDWFLDSPHVTACARGECGLPSTVAVGARRIEIPPDFGELLSDDPDTALRERLRVRRSMQDAFANGYTVRGFDPTSREYVLWQG